MRGATGLTIVIYLDLFGLKSRPFAMRQDARFPFRSEQYQNALETVHDEVVAKAPLTLLSGETGVGKTLFDRRTAPAHQRRQEMRSATDN